MICHHSLRAAQLRVPLIGFTLSGLLFLAGCGGSVDTDAMFADANSTNIQRVATLYSVYQGQHDWTGPANENDFKAFIGKLRADQLEKIGVNSADVDGVFKDETDGQSFRIRWGIKSGPRDAPVPIVFQATSVEGKYQVAFTAALAKAVEKSEYEKLWSGEQEPASANGPPSRSER